MFTTLTLPPSLQGFFSGETDFHFHQFLSNFFKYSFSNFLSFHPYNIFAIYFPSNFPFLKSFSFAISSFSCLYTSAFTLASNSITISLVFSKSSSLFQLSCSAINLFHQTKYFITPLTFLLFKIFSTSTSFASSTFYPLTYSLYHTI